MKSNQQHRRTFLQWSALIGAGIFTGGIWKKSYAEQNNFKSPLRLNGLLNVNDGTFTLPPLPYGYDAMEPFIDTETMTIHHDKHHQAYVTKLNEAIEKAPELKGKTLEELLGMIEKLPEGVRTAIRNHGGGHWNHSFFWQILKPYDKEISTIRKPNSLNEALDKKYGTNVDFFKTFNASAGKMFGSGWTWLIKDESGNLEIVNTPNQDNPMMSIAEKKGTPIIGLDLWEHAYYLKHQNKRDNYINGIWSLINWDKAEQNFKS